MLTLKASVRARSELVGYTFGFQRPDKTLHRGVVVAVAHPAHTDLDMVPGQQGLDLGAAPIITPGASKGCQ
jgi:hypothetical protein